MRSLIFIFALFTLVSKAQSPSEIDSLKQLIGNNDSTNAALYLKLLNVYCYKDYDSAQHYSTLCEESIHIQQNPILHASYLDSKGELFFISSDYAEALKNFHLALSIYENLKSPLGIAKAYQGIGITHHKLKNDTLASQYLYKALGIAEEQCDSLFIAECQNDLGNALQGEYPDDAINYYNEAVAYFDTHHKFYSASTCYNNLAIIYGTRKDYDLAERYFLRSYEAKKQLKRSLAQARTLNNLAYLQYAKSQEKEYASTQEESLYKSIDYSKRALIILEKNKSLYTKRNTYANLLNAYYELGDYKTSIDYQQEYMLVKDSIFNIQKQKHIEDLEARFQHKENHAQIAELEKEKQLTLARKTLQLSIAGFLLILCLILIFFTQHKRKKDRIIFIQQSEVAEKEKLLAEANLEKSKAKASELEQTIVYKTKQLSTHALHMIQKNELLHEVHNMLNTSHSKDNTELAKKIKRLVDRSRSDDNDWDVFKYYFEEVNQQFYKKLYELNPELTATDQKICALTKLNMSTKEMAAVLNIIPTSVKSARYRIKKKLGLEAEIDLDDFLRGLN